jgi:hypothetical protein
MYMYLYVLFIPVPAAMDYYTKSVSTQNLAHILCMPRNHMSRPHSTKVDPFTYTPAREYQSRIS